MMGITELHHVNSKISTALKNPPKNKGNKTKQQLSKLEVPQQKLKSKTLKQALYTMKPLDIFVLTPKRFPIWP